MGRIKSKGMHANAPNRATMSPKKGNIAAKSVATTTDMDRKTIRVMTLREENSSFFGSANARSSTTFVGCRSNNLAVENVYFRDNSIAICGGNDRNSSKNSGKMINAVSSCSMVFWWRVSGISCKILKERR